MHLLRKVMAKRGYEVVVDLQHKWCGDLCTFNIDCVIIRLGMGSYGGFLVSLVLAFAGLVRIIRRIRNEMCFV